MPWSEVSVMDQRREFVRLALQEGANRRELCRRFGISPDVGYKWLRRWQAGDRELSDQPRRPKRMPRRSAAAVEAQVVAVRDKHPAWGARKIAHCLKRDGQIVPAPSTVHQIQCRNERIKPSENAPPQSRPSLREGSSQSVVADGLQGPHATRQRNAMSPADGDRRSLALCPVPEGMRERAASYGARKLTATFRRYGLPEAFFIDNGSPWGDTSGARWTRLKVWLLKLGIRVVHARPCHPQGRGKNERFHRTLNAEVFAMRSFRTLPEVQRALDAWRMVYNLERPHQGLDMNVPADRIRPSLRVMPSRLPEGPIRRRRDGSDRLVDPQLYLIQRAVLESSASLCRRASRHPTARSRRQLRYLLY
jgi:transposase InsO family protein